MRLTAAILLFGCLSASAAGNTQTVTLNVTNAPLKTVLKEIIKQTKVTILYNEDILKDTKPVTIVVKSLPLSQVLDLCFKDQPFIYLIDGKTITIMDKPEKTDKTSQIQSPPIDVKGRVVNENNDPVENVNVSVKGTTNGTTTNANGEFFLRGIDDNATLVFTSVNTDLLEVNVKGRSFFDVALQTKVSSMQEVTINKGYYTEKAKFATGNVVSVKSKDIQNQPVSNPLLALVGRVPGVTIEQQTGFANSGIVVRIQGRNSINSGLDPLYVIDGVPYSSQPIPAISIAYTILGGSGQSVGGNPLSLINPNDIESIEILKDADATAIYGSRGANGVVLITTKKGKAGQTKVSANFRTGWGKVAKKLDVLNTQQYLEMRKESYVNDGLPIPDKNTAIDPTNYDLTAWDQNKNTDWQKVLLGGTAKYTDAQVGLSGGTSYTQFLLSTGFHRETTVFPGNFDDKKGSFQFNINHSSNNQKLSVRASGIYVIDNNQIPQTDLTQVAIQLPPNAPDLYNADGSLNWAPVPSGASTVSSWGNPLGYLYNRYSNKATNLIGSLSLNYKILKNLALSSRFGYNNQQNDEVAISPLLSTRPEQRPTKNRSSTFGNANSNGWSIEPQITYQAKILAGTLDALIGTSFQQSITKAQPVQGRGYSSDLLLNNLQAAPTVTALAPYYAQYKYNALYGRINYNLLERYILNATARRDGSSRFGPQNRFNNFWSIAGAWLFTGESWFKNHSSILSFGKLRASYGTSGNEQIGDYKFLTLYNPPPSVQVAYQGIASIVPTGLTNPYLQWEETNKFQFGVDLGFLNDRFNLVLNYYRNRSSNLLVQESYSVITGFGGITENFNGVVENTGWEISVNTNNIRTRNFSWTTNFNLTVPIHNGQLVSFPNIEKTAYAGSLTVGKSLNDQKVFHLIGVDPTTGIYNYEDSKGNPIVDADYLVDRIRFANTSQKLFGGMQNTISYKGFELEFSLQAVKRNAQLYYGEEPGFFDASLSQTKGNEPALVLNRWQKPGDVKMIQQVSNSYPNLDVILGYSHLSTSDKAFTDASFIRLTNLSFSWQIPDKWKKSAYLKDGRIFVQGQNLFTITKYKGLDPSVGASGSGYRLPPLQVITIGANVSF